MYLFIFYLVLIVTVVTPLKITAFESKAEYSFQFFVFCRGSISADV